MAKNPKPHFQVNREFQYDPLLADPKRSNELRLYLWLRANTSHKKENLKGVAVEKGQVIRSYQQMSDGLGLSKDQVRYSLQFLESHSYIHVKRRGTRASIITVYADADKSFSHSLEEQKTLENTGKNDNDNKDFSHSLEQSATVAQTDGENAESFPIVFSHSLKDAETLENTGKTETQSDEFSHRFFPPYENSIIIKRSSGIENTEGAESGENVNNSDPEPQIVHIPTVSDGLTAEDGVSDTVVTLTREKVRELTQDPLRQTDLLQLIEANNGEPFRVKQSVIDLILRDGL